MTTKKEQPDIGAQRLAELERERARQTHLVDPLTHPSSGDPPAAISPEGDRLGAVPMTRNAVADNEQARQEGLDAAKQNEPSRAEKASSERQKTSATAAHADRMSQPAGATPSSAKPADTKASSKH